MHTQPSDLLIGSFLARAGARPGGEGRGERGDVPGWVMVTVMTIGLAIAIFTFAEEPLKGLLSAAFDQVK